ncbi:MAG: CYTH domain-containing protein [Deltaproteobacteria bacterium]|nr:CYTH domain-containing protein [Deltaproteobacteria bacterium]MBI3296326.1 CYTH domain-containing protein [Deltaproteobacteria bacterium]
MKATQGVESELKYGLTREEYFRLFRAHRDQVLTAQEQVNFYFDDIHLNLRRLRIGLRIRFINAKRSVLTLKYPKTTEPTGLRALRVRAEYEAPLSTKTAKRIIAGKRDILSLKCLPIRRLARVYPIKRLCRLQALGSITTRRVVIPLNRKFQMELDQSKMFGKTFYELEVETHRPTKADKAVHNLFWKYDITYHPLRRSKLARFIEEWRLRQQP